MKFSVKLSNTKCHIPPRFMRRVKAIVSCFMRRVSILCSNVSCSWHTETTLMLMLLRRLHTSATSLRDSLSFSCVILMGMMGFSFNFEISLNAVCIGLQTVQPIYSNTSSSLVAAKGWVSSWSQEQELVFPTLQVHDFWSSYSVDGLQSLERLMGRCLKSFKEYTQGLKKIIYFKPFNRPGKVTIVWLNIWDSWSYIPTI